MGCFGGTWKFCLASQLDICGPLFPEECNKKLFKVLKYAVSCSNSLFRLLHWRGLWLQPGDSNYSAMASQGMTVSCFMLVLWKLTFFTLNYFELTFWNLCPRKPTAVLLECAIRRVGTFSTCVQSCTWRHMKGCLTQLFCGDLVGTLFGFFFQTCGVDLWG